MKDKRKVYCTVMASSEPPPGGFGTPPGKDQGESSSSGVAVRGGIENRAVFDIFGNDMVPAAVVLVLLLLNLLRGEIHIILPRAHKMPSLVMQVMYGLTFSVNHASDC